MNDLENRLREAYLAAAELIRDDAVPAEAPAPRAFSEDRAASPGAARTGPARRAWRVAPLAAAAVTAIAVTAGVGVPYLLSEQHPRQALAQHPLRAAARSQQAAPTHRPGIPGLPEFVVVSTDATDLQVIQTATGHVIAHVSAPAGQIVSQIAGDGSDRVFYVAAQQSDPNAACRSYFYRFSLSAAGQASALTPLPAADQAGLPTALALSADGSKLAFSITHCGGSAPSSIPLSQVTGYIGLLDTASGTMTRNWTFTEGEDYATALALTPDGSQLALAQNLPGGLVEMTKKLATDAPSGTVDQASTVIGLPGVDTLSAGAELYACIEKDLQAGNVANTLGVYELATGHLAAVLHTWTRSSCWIAPNAVHGHILVAIKTFQAHGPGPFVPAATVQVFVVDVSTGRLTTVLTKSAQDTGSGISSLIAW